MTRFSIIWSAGALVSAFVLPAAATARESVVYGFCQQLHCADGAQPEAGLTYLKGKLYGTTAAGGALGFGTVFSMDPATGDETVLHSFGAGMDGMVPVGGLIRVKGKLYGTTMEGGEGYGVVFSFDPATGAEGVYPLTNDYYSNYGAYPQAGLIEVNGLLYGTTYAGGYYDGGAVFSLDPATGVFAGLHSFGGGTDGAEPYASLIDVNGTLYGTTTFGGSNRLGTVFSVDPATQTETVLHAFCSQQNCADGKAPFANLINVKGTLYGTTQEGGDYSDGVVFSLDPVTGTETVLYSFQPGTEGTDPRAGLVAVNNQLYGTNETGGTYNQGSVFALNRISGAMTPVHDFGSSTDGARPVAGLIEVNGTLYGTTYIGGAYSQGTVFKLTR